MQNDWYLAVVVSLKSEATATEINLTQNADYVDNGHDDYFIPNTDTADGQTDSQTDRHTRVQITREVIS